MSEEEYDYEVVHVDPLQEHIAALEFVKREFYQEGEASPFIMGGAISSHVYNKVVKPTNRTNVVPNDIDIYINLPSSNVAAGTIPDTKYPMDFVGRKLFEAMAEHDALDDFEVKQEVYRFQNSGIATATVNGQKLEFILLTWHASQVPDFVTSFCRYPFDGFGMDIDGTIFGQRDAMAHLGNGIYRVDGVADYEVEYGLERFDKKKLQYPNLRLLLEPSVVIPERYKSCAIPTDHPDHKRFAGKFWYGDMTPDGKLYDMPKPPLMPI